MEPAFTLKQLPGDLLDHIFGNSAYSYLLVPLWICGDSIFNVKLTTNIRRASLRSNWPLRTGFPTVLLNLRALRHFSLEVPCNIMPNPLEWLITVKQFPETLESLSIVSADSHLALRIFAPGYTKRNKLYTSTPYELGNSRLIDVALQLPKLRTLILKGAKSLAINDLAALPASLTVLGLEEIDNLGRFMNMLPRSLVKLLSSLTAFCDDLSSWAHAPPNLEHISRLRIVGEPSDFNWLPRGLLKCTIDNSTFPFTPKLARSLPPRLRTIAFQGTAMDSFEQQGLNWASYLPRELTSLIFHLNLSGRFILVNTASITVGLAEMASLPKSLTRISLDRDTHFDWDSISDTLQSEGKNLEKWLPHLESLKSTVPHHVLHLLPPSLRHLEVSITYNGQAQSLRFPPLLTSLCVASAKCPLILFENSFPSSLKELNMPLNDPETCLRSIVFNSLPLGLTNLDAGLRAPFQKPHRFPPKLTRYKVNLSSWDWIQLLPATVTYISVHSLGNISLLAEKDYFQGFPPNLTFLRLERPRANDVDQFSNSSFSKLSRLISLNVKDMGVFPSAVLRTLPTTLEHLEITLDEIASEDAPFIPPYLTTFNLDFSRIDLSNPHIINNWPLGAVVRTTYTPLPLTLLDRTHLRVQDFYAAQEAKRKHLT